MTEQSKQAMRQAVEDLTAELIVRDECIEELEDNAAEWHAKYDALGIRFESLLIEIKQCNQIIQRLQDEKVYPAANDLQPYLDELEHQKNRFDSVHSSLIEERIKSGSLRNTFQALLDAYDGPKRKPFTKPVMFEKPSTDPDTVYGTKG